MSARPEDLLHDFRGPLNAITLHLEVLRRALSDSPTAKASLDTVQQQADILNRMLTESFDVCSLTTPGLAVATRALVEEALVEAGITGVTLAEGDWPAIAVPDERLLKLALLCLVRNARAATDAQPGARPPEISAEAIGEGVSLVVQDWARDPSGGSVTGRGRRRPGLIAVDGIARLLGGSLGYGSAGASVEFRLTVPRG